MFFTRVSHVIAYFLAVMTTLRIIICLAIIFDNDFENAQRVARRYLGSGSVGEEIDETLFMLVITIGFGVIAEISKSLRKIADAEKKG